MVWYYENDHTLRDIAEKYNVSVGVIQRRFQDLGVDTSRDNYWINIEKDKDFIINLYVNEESPVKPIADMFGVSETTIYEYLEKWGIPRRSYTRDITAEEKEEIIKLHTDGYNTYQIAPLFDTTPSTIRLNLNKWGYETSRYTYSANHNFFSELNTARKVYWLGFITSDGSINDRAHNNSLDIGLCDIDIDHLQKFLDDIESDHKIYTSTDDKAEIKITSPQMVSDLAKYGIVPRKAHIVKPHKDIDLNYERDYWRGQIDGDGSVGYTKTRDTYRPSITITGTYETCEGFMNYCKKFVDSKAKIYKYKDKKSTHSYRIVGKNAVIIIRELYEGAEVYLDRKYKIAMEILAQYS
jgi:transposase